MKSIKKNILYNLVKSLSAILFPVITFVYASRVLSVSGIGKINFSQSVMSYFSLLATLGLNTYGVREAAKLRDNRKELSKLVKELISINFISMMISYIVFFGALQTIEKFDAYREILLINSISLLFSTMGMEWLYGAIEEYRYITLRTLAFQVISLILMFLFVKDSNSCNAYAGIVVLSSCGSNAFNFIHSRKYVDYKIKFKLDLRKHIKPIFIFFANNVAGNVYLALDSVMLGFIVGDKAVGYYTASTRIVRIITAVSASISSVVLPRLSYYIEENDMESYKSTIKKTFRCIMLLAIPAAIGLFAISDTVLEIFAGNDFLPADRCVKIMCPVIIFISISTFLSNLVLVPFSQENKIVVSTLIGAIANFTCNSLWIRFLAQDGAAIGTVVAELFVVIVLILLSKKYIKIIELFKVTINYWLSALIMVIIIIPFAFFLTGIIKCVICIVLAVCVYFFVLYVIKDPIMTMGITSAKRFAKSRL